MDVDIDFIIYMQHIVLVEDNNWEREIEIRDFLWVTNSCRWATLERGKEMVVV